MTLNISQLCERIAALFSNVEQVDDLIIRYTRRAGEMAFAVYYLDLAQDLPKSQETLTKYQDRVIGDHYFEGRKSLQWSNYLYFVTSSDRLASRDTLRAKDLIERDRNYARKFVISEEELDSVLNPPVAPLVDATPSPGVLSVWTEILTEAGLERAILSDDDIPTRLKLIENPSGEHLHRSKASPRRSQSGSALPFIRSLQLKKFREFPRQRGFDFGTVNLIFGANGSGKTSLLEAIELFYCGRNKRNPNTTSPYEIIATLSDGRTQTAKENRRLSVFRDRNLIWYRQPEVRTNNLYLTFAQFNFLDTDAAVNLATEKDSPSLIEEDLAKLLVGSDAAKTWHNIERVLEAVLSKLRELKPLERQINEELTALKQRFNESASVPQVSDSIRARLEEMLRRVGWRVAEGEKGALAASLIQPLSELVVLAQQAQAIGWVDSPVSLEGLAMYCRRADAAIVQAEPNITRLEHLLKDQDGLADAVNLHRAARGLAHEAMRLIDAGVPVRIAERNKHQSTATIYSGVLAGLEAAALDTLASVKLDMTVSRCCEEAISERSAAEALLANAKLDYAKSSDLRAQSLNLEQELRQVASKILHSSPQTDACPLCHTWFGPGELIKRINSSIEKQMEELAQALLTRLRAQEEAVRDATAIEAATDWLRRFCERSGLPNDISVHSALAELEEAKQAQAEARGRLEAINNELLTLRSQGLSAERLEQISDELREFGYPLAEFTRDALEQLLSTIDQKLKDSSLTLKVGREQVDHLQEALKSNLGSAHSSVRGFRHALSELKERLATAEHLREKLGSFSSFPWPGTKPLAELAVEAEAIRTLAAKLQAALGRERKAQTTYRESIKRKEQLEQQREQLNPLITRLTRAQATLTTLMRGHSLRDAMKAALEKNREGIELIFSRIHSPAEFRGLGSSWTTLVRKVDGKEARLSEISTGQRAAFALSIFLAQNAQLKEAPPVVLIDDPIAHIDDLNSLSFLDYLREVVLKTQRQIFFATANEKLATLFERKFDFLNTEFRRFNLPRA